MLTDTGPLVALLDKDDDAHTACLAVLGSLPRGPLRTTWPCFTEAMYLLGLVGGNRYQNDLWQWRFGGRLVLLDLTPVEADRMQALMAQYANVPMDLADASLVVVAENRGYRRLFTIDSDFYIYRLADNSVLEVIRECDSTYNKVTHEEIRAQLPDIPGQRFHVTVRPIEASTDTHPSSSPQTITEKILARAQALPPEDRALLPTDLADQHDHYIYGWKKR